MSAAATCPHGVELWRKTRTGEHACPFCRRAAREQRTRKAALKASQVQPRLDVAALVAHDHTLTDDDPPVVVDLATARRRRRDANH